MDKKRLNRLRSTGSQRLCEIIFAKYQQATTVFMPIRHVALWLCLISIIYSIHIVNYRFNTWPRHGAYPCRRSIAILWGSPNFRNTLDDIICQYAFLYLNLEYCIFVPLDEHCSNREVNYGSERHPKTRNSIKHDWAMNNWRWRCRCQYADDNIRIIGCGGLLMATAWIRIFS